MPGDISGFVGTNFTNNQLPTGDIGMPTIADALQDSGAIDLILEEGQQCNADPDEAKDDGCNDGQPKTGREEFSSRVATVRYCETIHVTIAEGKKGDGDPAEMQDGNGINTEPKNDKNEKGKSTTTLQASKQDYGVSEKVDGDGCSDAESKNEEKDNPNAANALQCNGATDVTLEVDGGRADRYSSAGMQRENGADIHSKNDRKEISTNGTAFSDSGVLHGAHGGGQLDDNCTTKEQYDTCQDAQYSAKRCHQGTQTELSTFFSIAEKCGN